LLGGCIASVFTLVIYKFFTKSISNNIAKRHKMRARDIVKNDAFIVCLDQFWMFENAFNAIYVGKELVRVVLLLMNKSLKTKFLIQQPTLKSVMHYKFSPVSLRENQVSLLKGAITNISQSWGQTINWIMFVNQFCQSWAAFTDKIVFTFCSCFTIRRRR
jgi:hypothetical protein